MSDHQMNQSHMANGDDPQGVLERATVALRNADVPEGPPAEAMAQTLSALRSAPLLERPSTPSTQTRKILTMKLITKLAVAACIAAVTVWLIWSPISRRNVAFAEVIAQVQQAKSVRFKATSTVQMPNVPKQTVESTMTIAGNRMRQELPGMVSIMDFEKGVMLSLQPLTKQATRITMENVPPMLKTVNLMEQFRTLKADQARDLGEKEIDGRKLHGFAIENPGQSMTVWADPKTQTPVRIESSFDMPSIPSTKSIMRDFDWNATIDVADLSLDAPQGYTVQSVTMDASIPVEKDLIEGLRTLATINGNEFPASFDMPGMTTAVIKHVKAGSGGDRKKLESELLTLSLKISRGLAFVSPISGQDFHYAGKGAKLGEKDRPVLWYQPKGSKTYRVIDADLSAKDVAETELPKIESKTLMPGPTPYSSTAPATKPAR